MLTKIQHFGNFSKSESNIRVVRVQLNDGERIVGIRYPELLIQEVERAMKEQKMLEKAQKSLLAQAVSILKGHFE